MECIFFSFQAVVLAIKATEQFLNGLRHDVGDNNFDRLFLIHPTQALAKQVENAVNKGQRFRFFTPTLSASLEENANTLFTSLKNWISKRVNTIKSWLLNLFSSKKDIPTYKLSDLGVNIDDQDNFRAAPYILADGNNRRKKRFIIDALRKH